jgi:hypothetical protein
VEWFTSLVARVDAAFSVIARDLERWADPHPDRAPRDEEYSRVTNPAKWRIIGARADAWIEALTTAGLAHVEPEREGVPRWVAPPGTDVHRADVVVPRRDGALALVLARSRIEGVDDAGVTIGVGRPAVAVHAIPDCGCDACDSGSQDVLDELDEWVGGIVRGEFRRLERHVERPPAPEGFRWGVPAAEDDTVLSSPDRDATWALPAQEVIIVVAAGRWSARGAFGRGEVEAALASPAGWSELRGAPWSDAQ